MNKLSRRISRLGSELNLTLSAHEILEHCAIGLDPVNRKLLVANTDAITAPSFVVVDLDEIGNSVVIKKYGSIGSGGLKGKPLEQYLQSIVLLLELRQGKAPVEIVFYHHAQNPAGGIAELEEKARHWELVISKLEVPSRRIA